MIFHKNKTLLIPQLDQLLLGVVNLNVQVTITTIFVENIVNQKIILWDTINVMRMETECVWKVGKTQVELNHALKVIFKDIFRIFYGWNFWNV